MPRCEAWSPMSRRKSAALMAVPSQLFRVSAVVLLLLLAAEKSAFSGMSAFIAVFAEALG